MSMPYKTQAEAEHAMNSDGTGTYQTVGMNATGTPAASPPWHTKDRADQETIARNSQTPSAPKSRTVNRG